MTDNWDSYICEVDGKPASILVDLGAVSYAPLPRFPYLAYVTLQLHEPDEDGFPRREEFQRLAVLEDSLEAALTADEGATYIGRCIADSRCELIFYSAAADDWDRRVAEIMQTPPCYAWEAGAHYEPGWDSYLGFLFPGEQDLLAIQNRRLRCRLQEQGDQLEKVRPISHWLHFSNPEDGKAFCLAVQKLGFRVEETRMIFEQASSDTNPAEDGFTGIPGGGPGLARLALSRLEARFPVFQACLGRLDAPENIDETSFTLLDLATAHRGEYQGWSCPIEL
jgi:hypothetical protein